MGRVLGGKTIKKEFSGYNIERTAKLMKLSFSRYLQIHGHGYITVDQWVILQLIYKHGELSQQAISDLSLKDAPTVTRILDLLVQKNMITRSIDRLDRRKFTIKLTQRGQEVYHLILPILQRFREEAYDGITDKELGLLDSVISKIFFNLSKPN
jgi:DNA-binding MarR family transcriptional regulator